MAFSLDYTTNRGKVRLLISDIDSSNAIFQDDAIDAFVTLARENDVKRAAALALRTIAGNEVYVQKRIRLLDLQTDGPAEAEALRKLAADLEAQADAEETSGVFDWAEMVTSPRQYEERLYKERLRDN